MPKLNIYVDDELAKRIRELKLPMSEIARNALRVAVEKEERAVCKKCKEPAVFHVRSDSRADVYSCADHVTLYLNGQSIVRRTA